MIFPYRHKEYSVFQFSERILTSIFGKIAPKLLPITLVLSNLAVFLAATGQLLSGKNETFSFQYVIEIMYMVNNWYPGATYHVMCRGIRRMAIFREEENYEI